MKQLDLGTVDDKVAEQLRSLLSEPVILVDGDVSVGVLLPVENGDVESISLSLNPQFLAIIERSKKRLLTEGGLSMEEICKELEIELPKDRASSADRRKRKAN